jgi:hypothetical protein
MLTLRGCLRTAVHGAPSSSVSWSGSNGVGIIVRTSQCANGGEGLKNLESPQFMHHDRLNVCILCDRNPGRRYSGPRERKISAGKKLRGLCGSSPATGGPLSNRGHLSLHSNQYHEEAFVLTVFLVAACFTKLFLPPLIGVAPPMRHLAMQALTPAFFLEHKSFLNTKNFSAKCGLHFSAAGAST